MRSCCSCLAIVVGGLSAAAAGLITMGGCSPADNAEDEAIVPAIVRADAAGRASGQRDAPGDPVTPTSDAGSDPSAVRDATVPPRNGPASGTIDAHMARSDASASAPDLISPSVPVGGMDCTKLPTLPRPFKVRTGIQPSEDFTFDNEGYWLALRLKDLTRRPYAGPVEILAPNLNADRGLRMLPDGATVIANMGGNIILRVEPDGTRKTLTTNVSSPNGIIHGPGGKLYVSGAYSSMLYMLDPRSGDITPLHKFPENVDGIAFSLDYKTLYIADFKGVLYSLKMKADGTVEPPQIWVRGVGAWPDGMTTDECGNLYVTDHRGPLRRVTPQGKIEVVADFTTVSAGTITPAVNFGSGKQGWDAQTLYVNSYNGAGNVYEMIVGVRAAPPPPP